MKDQSSQTGVWRAVADAGLDPVEVARIVTGALAEDLSEGADVTTAATIAAATFGIAHATSRAAGVVAGLPVAAAVFEVAGQGRVSSTPQASDGDVIGAGTVLLEVRGPLRDLLTAERTALNLLTHLSGVATATHQWVTAVAGTHAQIRDTRKTLPGLRLLEKYAVRCGGGVNHRMSLSDAALIKDNHVAAAGSVSAAYRMVRESSADVPIEVEVDTIAQCVDAIDAGAEMILLDNMDPADLRTCVELARASGRDIRLEASGGLTLANAPAVAATGVDYLAVGALTHSAAALDIGLDLVTATEGD